jgi:transcriptional regulator with XRE-family HTH domain
MLHHSGAPAGRNTERQRERRDDPAGERTVTTPGNQDHDPRDPAAVRQRIARTIRSVRTASGRSLAEVARAAGIGKSTLHAIESGRANPGIETLWTLARALGVPFGALLEPPPPDVRVVRAGTGPSVHAESASMQARMLAASTHGARTELYTLRLTPGIPRAAAAHDLGTLEHVLVTTGRLTVGPAIDPVELHAGDFASFAGDVAHVYDALDDPTEAVLLIEYR